MAAQAVAAAPGCYQLWAAALSVPWRWPARAQWLQRAIMAVSSSADAGLLAGPGFHRGGNPPLRQYDLYMSA